MSKIVFDIWDADRVDWQVQLFGLVARLRVSESALISQIDLYCLGEIPRHVENALVIRGWLVVDDHNNLYPGTHGRIYRRNLASAQHLRRSRELLLRFLSEGYPTEQIFEVERAPGEWREDGAGVLSREIS